MNTGPALASILRTLQLRQNRNSESQNNEENEDLTTIDMARMLRQYQRQRETQQMQDNEDDDEEKSEEEEPNNEYSDRIQLDITLPKEWIEIEEQNSDIANEINKQLGPLGVLIFQRIQKLGIFKTLDLSSIMFLKPVLDYYETNLQKASTVKKSRDNLEVLLSVIPSIKQLKIGLQNRHPKENIIYRLVLEVLALSYQDKLMVNNKWVFQDSKKVVKNLILSFMRKIYQPQITKLVDQEVRTIISESLGGNRNQR
ncbi:UNKNOWN [Stylonychia lemnae]|uniref:Uncharacterized protein n=1 Tax=Stylonychia lemnae TaxID=5949 RepID=A0A078AND9_STYLE|nr:UNKNOWN [Stylonychia lemnae]|eukprot:CDW83421.1 UNKNOWN [Stylonychia lemnae]